MQFHLGLPQALVPVQSIGEWLTATIPADADTVADPKRVDSAPLVEAATPRGTNAQGPVRPTPHLTVAPVPTPAVKSPANVARVTWPG